MSPLRWFRKHATWMLIIFGVVLMAIFGLGPVFDSMAQGFQNSATAGDDPVIIKYRGGEITRSKLDELQLNHHSTNRFIRALLEEADKQCKKDGVQLTPLAQPVQPLGRSNNQDAVDEQMLVRKLLAERAEDEGVVVSDGMVDDYLALLANPIEFSKTDWKNINKLANLRMPMKSIKEHLRLELKAMQMQRYTSVGIPLNPVPTEAVELYSQANDRIECEVVPVSVEDYVSKVTETPSESELKALFEEGKYDYEDGRMQTPGFKVPRKVNVQYFVADMKTFLQNEKSKLTDAEVAAEYEKLVAAEDPIVIEITQEKEPAGFDLNFDDEADPKEKEAAEGDKADPAKSMPSTPAVTLPDETPAESGSDPQAVPTEGAEVQGTEVQGTEVQGTEVQGTEVQGTEVPETAPDQSLNVRRTKNQFVTLTAQEEEEASSEPAASQEDSAKQGDDVGGIGDLELSDGSAGPQSDKDNKKSRIKPLTEVADQIRDRLARSSAFKSKTEAAKRASLVMQRYQNEVLRWETSRDKDKTKAPEKPDFQALADENGLAFAETGLVDPFELRETAIGKVNFLVQVRSPQGPIQNDFQAVSNKIFLDFDRVDELIPQDVNDLITGNSYIYWMSEKQDVTIAEFSDAKDKVTDYWKHQKAIELAEKAAADMAEKANSAAEKLTALYPETAAPTGEFTWFRPGRGATATFGMPFGVDQPGDAFMQTAFSLENGKTGFAANESRDTIFVIQRITDGGSLFDLGEEFLDKQYFRFKRVPTDVMGAAQHYAQELEYDWRDEFVKSMELKRMK